MEYPNHAKEDFFIAEQSKRKGGKSVPSRIFLEEDIAKLSESGKNLTEIFETFMRPKELEGLRPWTFSQHRLTLNSLLEQKYPNLLYAEEIELIVYPLPHGFASFQICNLDDFRDSVQKNGLFL
ncbi:hypothetical protein V7150_23040 [Neobacillus drentensis]|uniref:hypothetical protein n=1 Tax=Neobacillus drentensis TaxID=220684 RepID=UPI003000854A